MANCANCRTTVTSHNSWCTACETVQYCGKQCQAEHWYDGNHAEICQDIGKRYWMKRAVEHPGALRRHAKSEHMSTAGYARHVLRSHKHHHGSTERKRAVLAQTFAKYRGKDRQYGGSDDDDEEDEGYHQGKPHRHFFEASLF